MGFCLFNQVAMAAHALRAEHGLERIAVVDWDVHHGNGTQTQFWNDRDVLFVSLHQFPFYPGTGALTEVGGGDAEGSTVNLPMPAGCGDVEYEAVFREIVVPVLRAFNPEFVLVSAGFDAHAQDPLGSMLVTQAGFRSLASQLHEFADQHCGGRLALALEGGYDLGALGASVREVAGVLTGLPSGLASVSASLETPLARDLVTRFREAHSGFWTVLR